MSWNSPALQRAAGVSTWLEMCESEEDFCRKFGKFGSALLRAGAGQEVAVFTGLELFFPVAHTRNSLGAWKRFYG